MAPTNESPPCVIPMPKAKPTQVIVHRIELQEKERDMLEAVVVGQTVKNVVVPVAVAGGVGMAGYLGYKGLKEAYDWGEDFFDNWQDKVVKLILKDPEIDISIAGDGYVTNEETGERNRAYPLPYYWIKALFD